MSNNDRANLRNWDIAQVEQHNHRIRMSRLHRLSANGSTPLSEAAEKAIEAATIFAPESKPIIRQSKKQPNKTEARFIQDWLKPWLHDGAIDEYADHESIILRIANGLTLRPDFPTWKDGRLTFYEVKGAHIREDSLVKLKSAAHEFKHIKFFLCQWKEGRWFIQEVLA